MGTQAHRPQMPRVDVKRERHRWGASRHRRPPVGQLWRSQNAVKRQWECCRGACSRTCVKKAPTCRTNSALSVTAGSIGFPGFTSFLLMSLAPPHSDILFENPPLTVVRGRRPVLVSSFVLDSSCALPSLALAMLALSCCCRTQVCREVDTDEMTDNTNKMILTRLKVTGDDEMNTHCRRGSASSRFSACAGPTA